LDLWPTSHSGRQTLLSLFQELAGALVNSIDPTSTAWWLVITQPGRSGNYIESSGSSMNVYALLKGLRKGYITGSQYSTTAINAYHYMVTNFVTSASNGLVDWQGTVSVGSLGGAGDYNYYISQTVDTNDLKGISAFVLASVEYERYMGL